MACEVEAGINLLPEVETLCAATEGKYFVNESIQVRKLATYIIILCVQYVSRVTTYVHCSYGVFPVPFRVQDGKVHLISGCTLLVKSRLLSLLECSKSTHSLIVLYSSAGPV